jgi:hypothetical protein
MPAWQIVSYANLGSIYEVRYDMRCTPKIGSQYPNPSTSPSVLPSCACAVLLFQCRNRTSAIFCRTNRACTIGDVKGTWWRTTMHHCDVNDVLTWTYWHAYRITEGKECTINEAITSFSSKYEQKREPVSDHSVAVACEALQYFPRPLWSISLSSMTTFFVVYIRATFFSSSYTLLQTMLYVICKAFVLMLLEQQLQMLEHCTPHMHVMILGLPTQLACVSSITTDAVIIWKLPHSWLLHFMKKLRFFPVEKEKWNEGVMQKLNATN